MPAVGPTTKDAVTAAAGPLTYTMPLVVMTSAPELVGALALGATAKGWPFSPYVKTVILFPLG